MKYLLFAILLTIPTALSAYLAADMKNTQKDKLDKAIFIGVIAMLLLSATATIIAMSKFINSTFIN